MPSQPRPASNNVIACLEAITAIAADILPTVEAAGDRAERIYLDPLLLGDVVRIERAFNRIRRHAQNARANRYEEQPA